MVSTRLSPRLPSSMAVLAIALLSACQPVLDPTLSPPIIDEPIHNCAETIAFSGAERDATIAVYVNGTEAVQVPIWMGWGSIKVPSALQTGDVVAAAQIVGNRISERSRDPVTVRAIPATLAPGEKLPAPVVMPPLYECQQVVRVNEVVQGATVALRQNASSSSTWSAMTPYTIARFGVPTLKVGDTYDAMDSLCRNLTSDWSWRKEPVVAKPTSLVPPTIGQPLVGGSDAVLLTGLVTGAAQLYELLVAQAESRGYERFFSSYRTGRPR